MENQPPYRLILASGSPARRELLAKAGWQFHIEPANIDEPDGASYRDPRSMVHHIAWLKAAAVASRIDQGVILAADTVGWHDGQAIGKPEDRADAFRIIRLLSGTQHELWTGVVLWRKPDDLQLVWQEKSLVRMAWLSNAEIDYYLDTRTWEGCSGAYAIQEHDDPFLQVVQGSVSNVIGLPIETMESVLRDFPAFGTESSP